MRDSVRTEKCYASDYELAGMHFLGDHLRDQDTQQSLNCKLKNKKSIITVTGCSW